MPTSYILNNGSLIVHKDPPVREWCNVDMKKRNINKVTGDFLKAIDGKPDDLRWCFYCFEKDRPEDL